MNWNPAWHRHWNEPPPVFTHSLLLSFGRLQTNESSPANLLNDTPKLLIQYCLAAALDNSKSSTSIVLWQIREFWIHGLFSLSAWSTPSRSSGSTPRSFNIDNMDDRERASPSPESLDAVYIVLYNLILV